MTISESARFGYGSLRPAWLLCGGRVLNSGQKSGESNLLGLSPLITGSAIWGGLS